ncbi:bifunctional adenosylcobinamide kinase/adenosylcobinamide-phosphate guanylyltransferase [Gluconacetobacter entanii]|uniref:bifunctional adenosylcobinamide kinase/adenosylcobinamide-phosphate guanylyltransferase n=1 Tax=Gluconacetobacter entanii TaxID=108528 RepID=UPI001C931F97|nr:bifunctional adenosylcobinamide kinase/adenosylcobinamide-phosphate guanylyltransferase [Gluconacetobacter entanii]MBY4639531.1 bifunctional adenosylcobinamide kinase/adenosylcobinamide-phosphate guanylyltransferase [Gluconacetobacter entanii]MCW4579878.1 bifunctional adenosylcobinamide kinase/adenosylcobinamide-phosphate guanylyltransferase [Gluconacetobacter entanii]MCW4583323.1 bifunctional adenosylcobinamide kinase/adenosylcobinamide-phosphate guanylyltransferase [Gluconacetobacter entani
MQASDGTAGAACGMAGAVLVLGGARSGKSSFAEGVVTRWPRPWTYVATSRVYDAEMRERVAHHRASRAEGWDTVEEARDIAPVLDAAGARPVLVDCLTLWLTNLLLDGCDIVAAREGLLSALRRRAGPTVLVGNEVGLGIVPDNALARRFRDEAGLLHQAIAREAGRVVFVAAGLPMEMK